MYGSLIGGGTMYIYGKTFDELNVGEKMAFAPTTVTETHITLFAGLSGDLNPLHINEEFAKKTIFGGRVAHGMLTASIMSGPVGMLVAGTSMALLSVSFKFTAPVRAGDTIRVEAEVLEKRPSKKYRGGVIKIGMTCKNQKEETVAEGEMVLLVSSERGL